MEMICRLCLKEAVDCFNIFDEKGNNIDAARVLGKHFWFEPCFEDPISHVICGECWQKVYDFHQFYLEVEKAHSLLSGTKANDSISEVNVTGDLQLDKLVESQPTEHLEVAIDIKEEYVDSIWQENAALNPLEDIDNQKCTAKLRTKQELHESETDNDMEIKENESKQLARDCDWKPTDEHSDSKKTSSKRSAVANPLKRLKRCKKAILVDVLRPKITAIPKRQKRQKMITDRDDVLVKKHISMGCELCPFFAEDFVELTDHFKLQHDNKKPYVMCCGRKLNKRFLVVQHAYKHEDPEYYKCKECNKVFSDGYVLRSHMLANHAPEEELSFCCDQCPKKFSRRYLLELHKPSHIPPEERKFWCNKCPQHKVFASDHLLQIHTNMRHTKAANVCHVCAKEIRDNQAFEKHVRLHFEDSGPRVKCPHADCDSWLKDEDNLKQHLRRHNDEGKLFVCNVCAKMCKNRRSLTSHIKYAHTNETFNCEECNKTFKKAITLREHMAQHTGETLYKCPFCTRTFNSSANMHSHKKKMHPLEWDIWRKTKKGSSQQLVNSKTNAAESTAIVFEGNSFNDSIIVGIME